MFRCTAGAGFAPICFPRIRGDVPDPTILVSFERLFSPHTRGCSCQRYGGASPNRVFPAYAGMFRRGWPQAAGLLPFSPHTRGCSERREGLLAFHGVFPAYAGMFLSSSPWYLAAICFPRIRGDVPTRQEVSKLEMQFSPHTRGYSAFSPEPLWAHQVFPAYAGMFRLPPAGKRHKESFPRIRGDIPEARPAMRKILLKKFSQQGSLFSFQTFRSGDHIKLALTFTKPKVDFLCPN